MTRLIRIAGLLAAACLSPLSQATILFKLQPVDGFITVQPGKTSGWGFDIKDDTTWISLQSATFTPTSFNGAPYSGPPAFPIGSYTDLTPFLPGPPVNNIFVVGPGVQYTNGTEVVQPFDAVNNLGTASVSINPTVPWGTDLQGTITFTYDEWNMSPNAPGFDPAVNNVNPGPLNWILPVEVLVIPEPGSLLLLGGGLLSILGLARAGKKS